jgi:hypothetical protein
MAERQPAEPTRTDAEPAGSGLRQHLAHASPALELVLLCGVMSFFADFTYEASRSVIGPYLGTLGAGAGDRRDQRPGRVPGLRATVVLRPQRRPDRPVLADQVATGRPG